ncbi:Ig-like domain-containing protein, partial [Psychrobacter sp. UBA3962]|uniref:Ig-like domain-containing protein n=1 Tax=Psychrobacter sp. UBA3962 TaxID=1947352 RepID=UPI0025F7C1DD
MSAKDHSITNDTTTNKLNTPLKASVVLVSAMLMAACGTNGKQSYNLEDVFGSSDIVYKPKTPKNSNFSEDGTKVSGQAEGGAIVKVKDEAGNVLGSATADDDGNFEITLDTPLTNGQKVKVEAYYPNSTRPSDPLDETAPIIKEPTEPNEPNEPEANKSGVQSINVGTSAAGLDDFVVTTRDFEAGDNTLTARADTASGGLLPAVDVQTSGEDDTDAGNGFKSHENSTTIPTALGELPLEYTSVYKDYGDDMRIGHIDGTAVLGGEVEIPVDGVAVVGHATKAENMPTEGTVGYKGDATYRKLGIGNDIEFGSSVFTADFVAKNVKGDLEFAKAGKISLTADIDGNKFSGAADANGGYATEGGFYGGDADYLGGVYEGNGAQGTYGA